MDKHGKKQLDIAALGFLSPSHHLELSTHYYTYSVPAVMENLEKS